MRIAKVQILQSNLETTMRIFVAGVLPPRYGDPKYFDFRAGREYTEEDICQLARTISREGVDRVILTGGEPLDQEPLPFLNFVRGLYRETDCHFILFTGFEWEQVPHYLYPYLHIVRTGVPVEGHLDRFDHGIPCSTPDQHVYRRGADFIDFDDAVFDDQIQQAVARYIRPGDGEDTDGLGQPSTE